MKKYLLIFSIFIFCLTLTILFNPKSVEGSKTEILRLNAKDVKDAFYELIHKAVTLTLQKEIKELTKLEFYNLNKSEAILLMDMLTSGKDIIVRVDVDTGYVHDFGVSY